MRAKCFGGREEDNCTNCSAAALALLFKPMPRPILANAMRKSDQKMGVESNCTNCSAVPIPANAVGFLSSPGAVKSEQEDNCNNCSAVTYILSNATGFMPMPMPILTNATGFLSSLVSLVCLLVSDCLCLFYFVISLGFLSSPSFQSLSFGLRFTQTV